MMELNQTHNSFYRFCIGFLSTIFIGVILACLRENWPCALTDVLAPTCASPWEQSKIAFWPLLGAAVITRLSMRERGKGELPMLVLTPVVLCLCSWLLRPSGNLFILLWVVFVAGGWALSSRRWGGRQLWMLGAAALAVAYVLFTFLPPMVGPFLDPSDVAAMATIPC